jgi:hypothetical protein
MSTESAGTVIQDALSVTANKLGLLRQQNSLSSADESCPTGGFAVKFTNQRSSFCGTEFPVQIEVEYTDVNGAAQKKTGAAAAGQSVTLIMADAGSAEGGISEFSIRVNTSCHPNPLPQDWGQLFFDNGTVSNGATLTFVLDNTDHLTNTTPHREVDKQARDASQRSKPVLIPIADPMFSKNGK